MTKSPSKPETGDQPPRDDRRQTTTESIVRQHRSLKAEPGVYQLRGGVAAFSHPPMPLPDQHPFYALIGRVAAEWAQIEHILDLTIWDLCAADHLLASCITGQIAGQYGRFNAIHALAAAKGFDKKMLDRIEHLSNTTAGLSKRRNRFVHGAWYTTGSEQGQFKSFSSKDGKFGLTEVTSTHADETIALIRQKATEVSKLRSELIAALPPATSS